MRPTSMSSTAVISRTCRLLSRGAVLRVRVERPRAGDDRRAPREVERELRVVVRGMLVAGGPGRGGFYTRRAPPPSRRCPRAILSDRGCGPLRRGGDQISLA